MDRLNVFNTIQRINRIAAGSLLVIFGLTTAAVPLGNFAILPLLGAVVILYGVLDWKSLPELMTNVIQRLNDKFSADAQGFAGGLKFS